MSTSTRRTSTAPPRHQPRGTPALRHLLFALVVFLPPQSPAPRDLPAAAVASLAQSLVDARPHTKSVWRDTPPTNADGTINGYIEIAKGDRRKWEFRIAKNAREIDREMPASLGGYPINYGFVPQTVSYDGDPFDVLVLGPPIDGGRLVRGVAVGVMFMEDEKGLDSKIVISPVDNVGRARFVLTPAEQQTVGDFFARYKDHEPGKFSRVPGWGTAVEGLDYLRTAQQFFLKCRGAAEICRL